MSHGNANSEEKRLAALYDYDVLDTPPEESFDRITRLVKTSMGKPIATLSLIDRDRQWYKSRLGTEATETARDISFCTHTIQGNEPLVVTDALADPRFRDSPLVTCEDGVRFYVGVPLRTPDGFNIGALCAIDTAPGEVSQDQLNTLQDLARLAVDAMELRKLATVDSLTGAMSRRSFLLETKKAAALARRYKRDLGCIMFDLDRFKEINDAHGHAAGDEVLRQVAATCAGRLRTVDIFGRLGGEEFAIVLPETSLGGAFELAERLRVEIAAAPIPHAGADLRVTASFGATAFSTADLGFDEACTRADSALYEAKSSGRNRVVCADPDLTQISAVA
jgi:diguanylate cyclase (GGDEF)-like protein